MHKDLQMSNICFASGPYKACQTISRTSFKYRLRSKHPALNVKSWSNTLIRLYNMYILSCGYVSKKKELVPFKTQSVKHLQKLDFRKYVVGKKLWMDTIPKTANSLQKKTNINCIIPQSPRLPNILWGAIRIPKTNLKHQTSRGIWKTRTREGALSFSKSNKTNLY